MLFCTTVNYQLGDELVCCNRELWTVVDKWSNPDDAEVPVLFYYRLEFVGCVHPERKDS